MTPRERVLAAVRHASPDRVPCDFWAEEPTWNRLLEHLGHRDRERVLVDLDIDLRHLQLAAPPERAVGGGVRENFWGERYVYQSTPWGPMREDVPGALAEVTSLAEMEAFPWPSPDQFDHSQLAAQCRRWDRYALLYGFADVWQRPALVRGWQGMFLDMTDHPDWAHYLSRKFTDFYKEDYARAAEATGGRIDLYLLISDLGSQSGPLVSPVMFHRFIAPYVREMVAWIHGLGGLALYHSCGAIATFIPDLIELGVDILDPIQPTGPEMMPERLAEQYQGRLCFHGGIDMQHLLPHGTPAEVQATVARYCRSFGPSGGYILGPTHLFQPDVPPENLLAVYTADRSSGS